MDPQLEQRLMIFGGFVPGAISLILLMGAWYIHAFKQSRIDHVDQTDHVDTHDDEDAGKAIRSGPRWMLPLMLALGFAGADYAGNYTLHLWPEGNNYRFTHAIGLIAILGILEGFIRLPVLAAFALRVIVYAGAFWMLSEGYVSTVFGDLPMFVGSIALASCASALIAGAGDHRSEQTPAWIDSITWILIAGVMMRIFLLNEFSIGAMIPAGIIAVLVSTLIVGLIFKDIRIARGGLTVLVGVMLTLLTGSIIQTGAVYLPSLLLLGIAPMVMLIEIKSSSGIKLMLTRLILLGVVLGSAVGTLQWSTAGGRGGSSEGTGTDSYLDGDYSP